MLKGNITPELITGTPAAISIYSVTEERNHYHEDFLEIIYCFNGSATLHVSYEDIILEEGDIISCDPHDIHSLKSDEENLFVSFYFDLTDSLFGIPDLPYMFFVCERYVLRKEKQDEIQNLKHLLLTMLYFYCFPHPKVSQTETFRNLSEKVIKLMMEQFHFYDYAANTTVFSPEAKSRFERIYVYTNKHYSEKLTVSKMCEIEPLNANYLSHFLKKTSFTGFSHMLNFMRIYNSAIMLMETDKNISDISLDVGFSDSKFYYRHFKTWYRQTPQKYRKYLKEQAERSEENRYYKIEEITGTLEHYISYYFATLHIPEFWSVPFIPYRNVPLKFTT